MSGKAGDFAHIISIRFEGNAEHRHPHTGKIRLMRGDQLHHLIGLGAVDLKHAAQERHGQVVALALAGQRRNILGQAATAKAAAGLEEARNAGGDALVAHAREVK